jgi:hypothetical protein
MAQGQNNGDAYMVANAAMAKMEAHERLCSERYKQIVANQNVSAQDREKMRALISERFNSLYGFLWKITFSLVGLLVMMVLGLIVFIANNSFVFRTP